MSEGLERLIKRILALPRSEIEQHAAIYQSRADQVTDRCRYNVAGHIAMRLYIHLNEPLPRRGDQKGNPDD